MDRPLKCFRLLSLEEIALRWLAANLWNLDSDILASIMKLRNYEGNIEKWESNIKEWESIIDGMKDKVMKLPLPESLTKRMVEVVSDIGGEIQSWVNFHSETFNRSLIEIFVQDSAKLYFTNTGTVDDRRMAQEMVCCNKISIAQRYTIACSYWLEDYIPLLWKELSEEQKEFYLAKNLVERGLQFSWPHIFKGEPANLDSYFRRKEEDKMPFNQWAFVHSAKKGLKATAECFFQKLPYDEKEASVMRAARAVGSADHNAPDYLSRKLRIVLHYLLSLMTPEQQAEIVERYPIKVMSCFFEWYRRDLFSENAGLIWPFISWDMYSEMMETFLSYDPNSHTEFFKESPPDFKKYVAEPNYMSFGLSILFLGVFLDSEDRECIELLFRSADIEARAEFLSDDKVLELFYDNMVKGKWGLVEVCLREAALSRENRKKLKDVFLECLTKGSFWSKTYEAPGIKRVVPKINERDSRLKSFFDFLDGAETSVVEEKRGQKRKLENCSAE